MHVEVYFSQRWSWDTLPTELLKEMRDLLLGTEFKLNKGSATYLREKLLPALRKQGWSSEMQFCPDSRMTITSIRENCGFCLQTGNMSRFYADLIKLEYLYLNGVIVGGIYVLPTKNAAKKMGSNIANFERMCSELQIFHQVIRLPLVVFGFE